MVDIEVSMAKGGDPFVFDYPHTDLADTFVFDSDDWGLYLANNVEVFDKVRPTLDVDGVTSLAGSWTQSITLAHLDTLASARLTWSGTNITVEYTVNGTTWLPVNQNDSIPLTTSSDFDIRVNFAGGVEDDPAELTRLAVYVLKTNTTKSALRTLTFGNNVINGNLVSNTTSTVAAAVADDLVPLVGTVEAWVTLTSGGTVFSGLTGTTTYVNGVTGSPSVGPLQHVVVTLATLANVPFTIGPHATVSHLAVYPQAMTAGEVAELYAAYQESVIAIHDPATITVSEHSPVVDIYAYTWSIVAGAR